MEKYFRGYVFYQQNDWTLLLPLAKFTSNNHNLETTDTSPFFAVYGYHPQLNFNYSLDQLMACNQEELQNTLKTELRWAQDRQETNANKHQVLAPIFPDGSMVWLSSRNLRTTRPSRKLD